MLNKGSRITLALSASILTGLSCTACLGNSGLVQTVGADDPTSTPMQQASGNNDLIRLTPEARAQTGERTYSLTRNEPLKLSRQTYHNPTYQPVDGIKAYRAVNPIRPLGDANGIDITVAEFAQSVTQASSTPLNLTYQGKVEDRQSFNAAYALTAASEQTGLGLDLSVRPHLSFDYTDTAETQRAGAEFRVSMDLDQRGQELENSQWYLFVGQDNEAVIWNMDRGGLGYQHGELTLQDKITVGDIQAGIGFESPAGQMAISYISREYTYKNGEISRSGEEDFTAISLTWRY